MAFEEQTPFGVYRQCRKCHVHMPATDQFFPKAGSCFLGLASTCKECSNVMTREHYRERLSSLSRIANA